MITALHSIETKTEHSGGVGEMNSRPAFTFATAEFRANEVDAPPNLI